MAKVTMGRPPATFHGKACAAIRFPLGHPGRRIFWDVEYREQEPAGRPLLGDERLCANVLIKAIQESKGVTPDAEDECIDCHEEAHPHCYTEGVRNGEPFITRHNRGCTDFHTIRQCAASWLASDIEQPRDRARWSVLTVCDHLGIEPSYLRRCLARPECETYWADEAKVNSFLEFFSNTQGLNTEAFGVTGHTDSDRKDD